MKTDSKIRSLKAKPGTLLAGIFFVASVILIVIAMIIVQRDANNDQNYLQQVADLRAQAYQLTALSRDATSGDEKAFDELNKVVTGMGRTWEQLRNSDERTRRELASEFSSYDGIWGRVKTNAQAIATNKELIVSLNNVGRTLNENLPSLQSEHSNIVDTLLESKAPAEQTLQAQVLSWRASALVATWIKCCAATPTRAMPPTSSTATPTSIRAY